MAKNFLPPPANILSGEKSEKFFNASLDGVIPAGVNAINKILPINVPLFDPNDLPVGFSPLGTLIQDNLQFIEGKYLSLITGAEVPYDGLVIDTCVFEATQQKNIIKTYVQGRPTPVKEYIATGEVMFNITGAIVNNSTYYYPTRDVSAFTKLMQAPKPLEVRSKFVALLGFKYLTVESWALTQEVGRRNVQGFTLQCSGDTSSEQNDLTGEATT